jgi:hypothetical protein
MTIEHPSRQKKWAGGRSCQLRPIQENPERIRGEIYKLRNVQRAEAAFEIVDVASVVDQLSPCQIARKDPAPRICRSISNFVARNGCSDGARRFQPVAAIIPSFSLQLPALTLDFFLFDKMPSGFDHVPESFRSTGTAIPEQRPAAG